MNEHREDVVMQKGVGEKEKCSETGKEEGTKNSNGHAKEDTCSEVGDHIYSQEEEEGPENSNGQTAKGATQNGVPKRETCLEIGENICNESQDLPLARFKSSEARQELARQIIGPSLFNSLATSMEQVQSLEEKMVDFHAERSRERSGLSDRQSGLTSQRAEISERMSELRLKMKELEAQDQRLAEEEDRAEAESEKLEASLDSRLKCLEGELTGLEGGVHARDEAVRGAVQRTAEKITELEEVWLRSFSASLAATPSPNNAAAAASPKSNLDRYLQHVRSYARDEGRLLRLVRRRAATATSRATELEQELEYSRALGMGRTVELMSNDLRILEVHISEDTAVIAASRKTAQEVRSDLFQRVEGYREKGEVEKHQSELFDKIAQELKDIETSTELEDDEEELDVGSQDSLDVPKKTNGRGISATSLDNPAEIEGVAVTGAAPVLVAAMPKMPKLSWANKANSSVPKKKTMSLLDIQQAEMLDKEGTLAAGTE